ncbi:RteC domain-containing protein [Mucilaginibacter sp. X5P1]|uniref:RteC domain-containing protein n=1 Tax=Mucilaginibacter sp. X5P1 TaxID=2723088 RepID=UPI00160B3AA3|nr:RteC domain-containing protein [Mucilaginibacter sp. X5P1]MBB6137678.1 hypothetical protein [Mucilaginibacter sp. X5P1]
MKKPKFDRWLAELQAELGNLDGAIIAPLDRLRHTAPLISGIINDIKEEVLKNGFETNDAEIHFFKVVKPGFYALQLFELEWYNLCINKPVGTSEMIRKFYEDELLYLMRFFRNNAFYYQYYRLGASELDQQYFLREGRPGDIPVLDVTDPLPGFSTTLDYLFAKFIAYERLQFYLVDQLTMFYIDKRLEMPLPKLRWTGEKINIVELAYGIYFTGQINDGKAEVMEIIAWLNESLALDLSPDRAYRMFLDIKRRKTVSPTRFIDRMCEEVKRHIEDSFSLKKAKRTASKN